MELMTQGSSAVERLVRKNIVWCKTLKLVLNIDLLGKKKQEDFDSSKN